MSGELPVDVRFLLSEEWREAEPDEVGAPDAAYVALRPEPTGEFVANITVSGQLADGEPDLTAFADESLERLRQDSPDAALVKRTDVGSEHAPGITQVVSLSTDVGGAARRVMQVHVFLAMDDAVIELVLSALPEEIDHVIGDFRDCVASVAPGEADARYPE